MKSHSSWFCLVFLIGKPRICTTQRGSMCCMLWVLIRQLHQLYVYPKQKELSKGQDLFTWWCMVLNLHSLPGDFLNSCDQLPLSSWYGSFSNCQLGEIISYTGCSSDFCSLKMAYTGIKNIQATQLFMRTSTFCSPENSCRTTSGMTAECFTGM